jgi:hypothetical protein
VFPAGLGVPRRVGLEGQRRHSACVCTPERCKDGT